MRPAFLIVLAAMFLGLAVAWEASSEDEIRKAEKGWAAAVTTADYATLEQVLGDQLIYAHSTGVVESKSEYLSRLRKGAQKYDAIEHHGMTVKTYGDAAVVHAKVRMAGKSDGRPFNDRLMMLHLWIKQGGKWQLAAHQTTALP